MILLACLSVLVSVAGRTVFHVARAAEAARVGHDAGRALTRLHRTLRDDARTATAARVGGDGLQLDTPGGTVRYRAAGGAIRRERSADGRVVAGDTFPLAAADIGFAADGRTAEIRWNHAALAASARGGPDVRLAVIVGGR